MSFTDKLSKIFPFLFEEEEETGEQEALINKVLYPKTDMEEIITDPEIGGDDDKQKFMSGDSFRVDKESLKEIFLLSEQEIAELFSMETSSIMKDNEIRDSITKIINE